MRILVLSTYPMSAEGSGGVVRLRKLVGTLTAGGIATHVLAIVPTRQRAHRGPAETILPLPEGAFSAADWSAPGYHDVLTGLSAKRSPQILDALTTLIADFKPDAIMLEQPFLSDLALEAVRLYPAVRVIYSAANIEARLKRKLAELTPQNYRHHNDLVKETDRIERLAVSEADLVIAISASDAAVLDSFGSKRTVICGNGSSVADAPSPDDNMTLESMRLAWEGIRSFGCIGSAYWPNAEGLAAVASPSLAFLPSDCRLVTIGRIGSAFKQHPAYRRGNAINDARIIDLGFVPDDTVALRLRSVDVLVMPVFVGGGSMLKAADILSAGRLTLMSRLAVNGYEEIVEAAGDRVRIADTVEEFRLAWVELCKLPKAHMLGYAEGADENAQQLAWNTRLSALVPAIKSIRSSA